MPKFVSLREAVANIRRGDHVWSNAFLALANPIELQSAIGERFRETGEPGDLTFCCCAGFGDWKNPSPNEEFVRLGAVKSVILGHYSSTAETSKMVLGGEIQGYNLPLGVMSKMVRAAASGESYFITDIGLNLFVDPMYKGYQLNGKSKDIYVDEITIDGKRRLKYRIPPMNVALIKGSSTDREGNISFEKEATVTDALSLAQAVKRQGGTVLVQVESILDSHQRPWNVVVPSTLVDYIVVCPGQTQVAGVEGYLPSYAGDEFYEADPMRELVLEFEERKPRQDTARALIAKRAVQELRPGSLVNIGIGIPESVAVEAAKSNLLKEVSLTVESGATKGVPASGAAFGATIGAHSICSMAQQFDLYDGGGLDICFIGALEIDGSGNVNAHMSEKKLSGIGGFANITQSTPTVVFCATFTSGGLKAQEENGRIQIRQEGRYPKFVRKVRSVSFSAENAKNNGQTVLYVTERCVFRLIESGLELIEVGPGIDLETEILKQLPFEVSVSPELWQAAADGRQGEGMQLQ